MANTQTLISDDYVTAFYTKEITHFDIDNISEILPRSFIQSFIEKNRITSFLS